MAQDEGPMGSNRWDALAGVYGSSPVIAQLPKVLVDTVGVSPGDSVIDIGTGTGLALIAAARAGGGVGPLVGVDRSFGMLNAAAGHLAEAALAGVVLVRADAARIPVRDASFDVALAASVWQFLGYSPDALAEWRRVLRPGGRLGFSVPGPGPEVDMWDDLIAKYSPRDARASEERPVSPGPPRSVPDLAEAATAAGFSEATVINHPCNHILPSGEDWWALQWTHGLRFFLGTLDPKSLEALKREALDRLMRTATGEIAVTLNLLCCVSRC